MKFIIPTIALLISSSSSFAADIIPHSCSNLAMIQDKLRDQKVTWGALDKNQFIFLEGVFAILPDTPKGLPLGDSAITMKREGEDGELIFFVDGLNLCDPLPILPALITLLDQVGDGRINHFGADN